MSTVVSTDKTRPNRVLSSKKCKSFFLKTFLKYYKHSWYLYKLNCFASNLNFRLLTIFDTRYLQSKAY